MFQGRFKAVLVDRDAYLLEVCRYVELNPVRARLVALPSQWRWSSYLAHTGAAKTAAWLDTSRVARISAWPYATRLCRCQTSSAEVR